MDTPFSKLCWLCSLLLVTLGLVQDSGAELLMVYNINRHGARNFLPKGLQLQENALRGGPTLLPLGQRQCYDAGSKFRERYITNATCSLETPSTCLYRRLSRGDDYGLVEEDVGFGNWNTEVRASSLDRAILSGLSFYAGVFPANKLQNDSKYLPTGAQLVPIYTEPDGEDISIRAYTKCTEYQRRIRAWFSSEEFKQKEAASKAVRDQVASYSTSNSSVLSDTSLENWWNVYEGLNSWITYDLGDDTLPMLEKPLFDEVKALANWLETRKMQSKLTGNLLGGVLLGKIRSAMISTASTLKLNSYAYYYKLNTASSHYNTQLAVLAAMKLDMYAPATQASPWFTSIPALASVLAFEVHGARPQPVSESEAFSAPFEKFYVRLVAQNGPTANYTTIPMPCESPQAAAELGAPNAVGICTLDAFLAMTEDSALDAYGWCTACGNVGNDRPTVCALQDTQEEAAHQHSNAQHNREWAIGTTVVMCVAVTALLGVMVAWAVSSRRESGSRFTASGTGATLSSAAADVATYAGMGKGAGGLPVVQMSHHQI